MSLGLGLQEQAHRTKHRQPHLASTLNRTGFIEQDHVRKLLPGQRQGFAFAVAEEKGLLHAYGVCRFLERFDDKPAVGNRALRLLSPSASVAFAHHFTVHCRWQQYLAKEGLQ